MAEADQDSPLPRFTLADLLELIAAVALFLALVTQLEWLGFGAAVLGLLIFLAARHVVLAKSRRQAANNLLGCLLVMLMLALVVALLLPMVTAGREAAHRANCLNRLKQLVLALHFYYDDHGHFPPPYVADAAGKPMHSWRVLILPYIEEQKLFKAYDMNEPWDGPNNRKLAAQVPTVFRCPADRHMPPGMTSYFCITGPGRMKPGSANLRPQDIRDLAENTIAVVESTTARVNWLEPRDLTVEDILAGKNTADAPCACSYHGRSDRGPWRSSGGFNAVMFDGWLRFFPARIDPVQMRALLTIDGGELPAYDLPPIDDTHLWPGVWLLLAAEAVFLIFAIIRRVRIDRRLRRDMGT